MLGKGLQDVGMVNHWNKHFVAFNEPTQNLGNLIQSRDIVLYQKLALCALSNKMCWLFAKAR